MERRISGHHLVHGVLRDYLTGEELPDTDDERRRQALARMLVESRGFSRHELEPRLAMETRFGGCLVRSVVDLTVSIGERRLLIVRYGPGSLVTREKPALAAARTLDRSCCIPLAVVTNGLDAELLETASGRVLATGLGAIPSREEAERLLEEHPPRPPLEGAERERNLRVLNVFDQEACCRADQCG